MTQIYDVIIIGAGPAGLTASIYASCFKLSNLVIGNSTGGQMALSPDIINYPGFSQISGKELTERMVDQTKGLGATLLQENVVEIQKTEAGYRVVCEDKSSYQASIIILATGVERKKLNVKGELEYTGKGVQYCASCETFGYQDKLAAVVGGANAAVQVAIQIAHAAKKVYLLNRSDTLRADPIWLDQLKTNRKIEILYKAQILEIRGDGQKVTELFIQQTDPSSAAPVQKKLPLDLLFIEIGGVPGTALLSPLGVDFDERGFISVDDTLQTNVPGIFAAGDVISHTYSIEQISSAVGLGARAATSAFSYFTKKAAPTLWGKSQLNRQVQK